MDVNSQFVIRNDVSVEAENDLSLILYGNGKASKISGISTETKRLLENKKKSFSLGELVETLPKTVRIDSTTRSKLLRALLGFFTKVYYDGPELIATMEVMGGNVDRLGDLINAYPSERCRNEKTSLSRFVYFRPANRDSKVRGKLVDTIEKKPQDTDWDALHGKGRQPLTKLLKAGSPIAFDIYSMEVIRSLFLLGLNTHIGSSPFQNRSISEELASDLLAAGFYVTSPGDEFANGWEFHDLLMHQYSRWGYADKSFGGTFPFLELGVKPEPALKRINSDVKVSLPVPDPSDVLRNDLGLTEALESRRSIRKSDQTITLNELAEFLYRVARVRAVFAPGPGVPYETVSKPYPGGGAVHELNLYVTVVRCIGLNSGIYYYDGFNHWLMRVGDDLDPVIDAASLSTGQTADPDVIITVTSRFNRMNWKYRSMAYSATLKNVGVLYQTMYLVATAMELSPCALGAGESPQTCRSLGIDFINEAPVGEFILSGRLSNSSLSRTQNGDSFQKAVEKAAFNDKC